MFSWIDCCTEAYDALDPIGNITIKWDILSWTSDGYVVSARMISFHMPFVPGFSNVSSLALNRPQFRYITSSNIAIFKLRDGNWGGHGPRKK